MIHVKRVYEPASSKDGLRVLVDRVWPRGMTKAQVAAEHWLKDLAPSTTLRKWFNHDVSRWPEFRQRYFKELDGQADAVAGLRASTRKGDVTLLYSARDAEHNQAVALKEYLQGRGGKRKA